jgi:hypothetical protein
MIANSNVWGVMNHINFSIICLPINIPIFRGSLIFFQLLPCAFCSKQSGIFSQLYVLPKVVCFQQLPSFCAYTSDHAL